MTATALEAHPAHRLVHGCGDSPFPGGVGKTRSAESFTSLLNDVSNRLFDALPDDTWFYPATPTTRPWASRSPTSTNGVRGAGEHARWGVAEAAPHR